MPLLRSLPAIIAAAFAFAVVLTASCASTPAIAQKSKDTLRFPLSEAESGLDPYLLPGSFNNTWEPSVWDNLLGFDSKKVEFVPLIAKTWSQPDALTYEFELRDDLKWHDGEKVDADDVVYTMNYILDPKVNLRYKSNWAWLASVEKLGQYKVRLKAKFPAPDGMMWMAFNTSVFPEHAHGPLADKGLFAGKPIGTGPLKIVKIDKNTGIVAERNPNYQSSRAKQAAPIGRIVAEPLPDVGTVVAKFLVGEVDVTRDVPPDQSAALRDSGRAEFTLSPPALGYSFMGFPTLGAQNVKALGDARVRLAIMKAIDRNALVRAQYGDIGKDLRPAEALCSKEQLGCGYTKMVPDYDPAGAKKLLAEAGYGDGFDVQISTFSSNVTEVTAVTGMLRAVGIRATVRTHPTANRVKELSAGKVDIGYYGWSGGGMFEVSSQIVRHFLSKEYEDPKLVEMAEATGSMMDDAARRKEVAKLMDYAHDQAYAFPMVPNRVIFTHTKEVKLLATDLRNGQVNPHEFGWK
jgi:peptide/nickel transport system substrate-binding protein